MALSSLRFSFGALASTAPALRRFSAGAGALRAPSMVLVNGQRVDGTQARLSVWDTTVQRGDGMFEVVRVLKSGAPVGLSLHLDRLYSGAAALDYTIPAPREAVGAWISEVGREGGEGMVRVLLTRGSTAGSGAHLPGFAVDVHAPPCVVVMWQPLPRAPPSLRLHAQAAWWHPAGSWQTVKWLSYAPNMMMTRVAQRAGYDDALLTSEQGVVLDGPTFAVGWFKNNVLHTPCARSLGLLPSCTLALVLEAAASLGIPVKEGVFHLREVLAAEEMFVSSSTRDVLGVSAVGEQAYAPTPGPQTAALAQRFRELYLSK